MNNSPQSRLAEIQAKTGLGQTALAALLGVSQATVNRIINGQMDCRGSTLSAIQSLHAKVSRKRKAKGAVQAGSGNV